MRRPVRITYAAIGGGSAPVWAAYEAGLFARNGLDVELSMIRGSGAVSKALLANEVQFGNIASPSPLKASLEAGRDLVYLTGGLNYMVQCLVVSPEITEAAQLKGKAMGRGNGATNLDEFLFDQVQAKVGVHPAKDMTRVLVDSPLEALGKLERKEIAACLFSPPWLFEATKRGFRILMDADELKIDFQLGGIVASKELVAADPDLARRVVKGYVEGVHYFRRHPEFAVTLQKKYSKVEDPDVARQCHARYSTYFKRKPYPSAKGIQTVLAELSRRIPEAATAAPERFIDRRWLDELDGSGFIDDLYRREPAGP